MSEMITKQDCYDSLDEIAGYKQNWNGYGAEPFSPKLIENAKLIVDQLFNYPMIFPTAAGSIQFEFTSDNVYIEVEIYEDRYKLFVGVNGKCADVELQSESQVMDWWDILVMMANS